jgi:hypothetical protein
MKNQYSFKKGVFCAVMVLLAVSWAGAQSDPVQVAGSHNGTVTVMAYDVEKGNVISGATDGFIGIWSTRTNSSTQLFQASPYSIRSMVLRPGKSQVALVESDGLGLYRVSAWDYEGKKNLFTLRFKDPVSFINYSTGGNFLIISRTARAGLIFINPETGATLFTPPDLGGSIGFAATGRTERTMIIYATSGAIAYWDLESGKEIQRVTVPANLQSPIFFGNNRFLAGLDNAQGLLILDAVSGKEIARDRTLIGGRGKLFSRPSDDISECIYLGTVNNSANRGAINVNHYTITVAGKLETKARTTPSSIPLIASGVSIGNGVALGTVDGRVWNFGPNDTIPQVLNSVKPKLVTATAASGSTLAFITEDKLMGTIPLGYQQLRERTPIALENSRGNTHISADPAISEGRPGRFLIWQSESVRSYPLIMSSAGSPERKDMILSRLPLKTPLRSASLMGNKALFLDSSGNINILSTDTGNSIFTFVAADSLDISFFNDSNIIIGRSTVTQNSPFLKVNITTKETVSLSYPSAVGARVYRAPSGTIYGGVVDGSADSATTTLIALNTDRPADSTRMVEYQGEDTNFVIAENGNSLASTIGGDGATLYGDKGLTNFERSTSLPVTLLSGDKFFITLGKDGSISWYDADTGRLLARIRLYDTEWIMELGQGRVIRGPVQKS